MPTTRGPSGGPKSRSNSNPKRGGKSAPSRGDGPRSNSGTGGKRRGGPKGAKKRATASADNALTRVPTQMFTKAPKPGRQGAERLQKVLARAGVASRRKAEELIEEGRVRVNDTTVLELGVKVDPEVDEVRVDGKKIRIFSEAHLEKVYLLLNKPPNTLTTTSDDRGRKTVMELISNISGTRLFPVGRLDFDAEGALLLTNDGDLAHRLTHPRFHVPKTYHAKVKGRPTEESLEKIRRGLYLDDGPTKPAHVEILQDAKVNTWCEITVTEGRNRLIKRMFWRIRHPVMKLIRVEFAGLNVDGMRSGDSRMLTKAEVQQVRDMLR